MRCILASEQLRANSTPNLTIAINKANRKGGSCSSRGCLHPPWPFFTSSVIYRTESWGSGHSPHDGIPSSSHGISNQSHCINCAVAWVGNEYAIAADDYDKEGKRIERSWYPATICRDTSSGNEQETADRDGDIEKLRGSNAPKWPSDMLFEYLYSSRRATEKHRLT